MMAALRILVSAALLRLTCSNNVEHQIEASGKILVRHPQHEDGLDEMLAMIRNAKKTQHEMHRISSLVRSEVRRHLPSQIEAYAQGSAPHRLHVDESLGLLDLSEVDCSFASEKDDPVSSKLCKILHGTNIQVAGKLERAVKGLSLRPHSANETAMVVADASQDRTLTHLKAALWDMWFCAKRVDPPCDPLTTDDTKVKAAREAAFDSLKAIHMHAVQDHKAPAAPAPAAAAAASPWPVTPAGPLMASSLLQQQDVPPVPTCMKGCSGDVCTLFKDTTRCRAADQGHIDGPCTCGVTCTDDENTIMNGVCVPKALPLVSGAGAEFVSHGASVEGAAASAASTVSATGTAPSPPVVISDQAASEKATKIIDGMTTPPNVSGKLFDAINGIDIDDTLQKDIVRITEEADGNLRKLKASLLVLHECAAMPDCPGDGCCTPKSPTQAIYVQAKNDAYIAYHQVEEEGDEEKNKYLALMGNIANGKTTTFPPGHPRHGQERFKRSDASYPGQEDDDKMEAQSCRHSSLNDTVDLKRMSTGSYCVDLTKDTADASGNVMDEKELKTCETWKCTEIAPESAASCAGGSFKSDPYKCFETNHTTAKEDKAPEAPATLDILLVAIVIVTVVVVGAIGFLVTQTMGGKEAPAAAAGGGEEWAGEGEGGY